MKRAQQGITLVALIITIIVLLILAGVTLNLVIGEDGIFKLAEEASKKYENSAEKEKVEISKLNNEIGSWTRSEAVQETVLWEGNESTEGTEIKLKDSIENYKHLIFETQRRGTLASNEHWVNTNTIVKMGYVSDLSTYHIVISVYSSEYLQLIFANNKLVKIQKNDGNNALIKITGVNF